ncbi:uncharacterized protein LOC130800072 isoform X2 [Amaranthus tricolor]|uniref:uncharacterized protein LOC130800072 isoform X2 n=1 Tax=Amaranthus tricolor TaxID=29722 RepID=UPI00258A776A|nr:uncharacterized protein LOC130800072 isoform X2 [Amaranthus tricolor]
MFRTCFWCDFAKDWFSSLSLDEREIAPPNSEDIVSDVAQSALVHGINVAVEFKPVEHPIEPLDSDKPVQCPLPEPSILNSMEGTDFCCKCNEKNQLAAHERRANR